MPVTSPALVTAVEMRALEAKAVLSGVSEDALMEEAGAGMAEVVRQFWPRAGAAVVFCGKGHNAGDACVLSRHLLDAGWQVEVRAAFPPESWRALARQKLEAISARVTFAAPESEELPSRSSLLLVDGLLGTGAGGVLKSPVREAARMMNLQRERHHADTLAIDLPSGLDADTGAADADAVVADVTVTLGYAKCGLVAAGAENHVGRIALVPLALPLPDKAAERPQLITPQVLRPLLQRRAFSMHKGQAGRVGIVAGSRGLTGAARLAATAAVASGGGLVTLFCPHDVYEILAASCPPEVMVRPVHSCREVMEFPLDAIGIGPGMGAAPPPYIAALLRDDPRPVIVDADALNAMAAHRISLAERTGGPRLMTPHPGELARLAQTFASDADNPASALAAAMNATVLGKGARSAVIESGRPLLYNTTGHPMMAKGGFGDVLTGFCTTFAAQGVPLREAAALGSWLLGFAAEQARIVDGNEVESFTPSRLIEMSGRALAVLRYGDVW